jgi:hypothetical protein
VMERNNWPVYWRTYIPAIWQEYYFCITKGIPQDFTVAKSCFDLSSDHSPVSITLKAHALNQA